MDGKLLAVVSHKLNTNICVGCLTLALFMSASYAAGRNKVSDGALTMHGATERGDISLIDLQTVSPLTDPADDLYEPWTSWSTCSHHCKQKRFKRCRKGHSCDEKIMKEKRPCLKTRGTCSPWWQEMQSGSRKNSRRIKGVVYDLLYKDWSEWSACTRSCKRRRYRTCALKRWCKNTVLLEEKKCYAPGTGCERRYMLAEPEEGFTESGDEPSEDKFTDDVWEEGSSQEDKKKPDRAKPTTTPYDAESCGIREVSATPRIVGGYQSRRGSWPWQIAVMTRWKEQYCGGVLIAPQWAITAAHCVRKKGRRRRVMVRAGEHTLDKYDGTELNIKVVTDFVHPDFDMETIDNDIALLKLKTPLDESKHVRFACLPEIADELPVDTLCYAVGWGKMKNTHLFGTDILREAPVPIVDREKCQEAFEYEITENQLCAGYKKGGVDTCSGDSGGPLMCRVEKNGVRRWHVYGVTSFGEGCGDRGKYGIYSRVTKFSQWIQNVTKHN